MIVDKLENLKQYDSLHPLFSVARAFLESHDLETMDLGKIELEKDRLMVNIATTGIKNREAARLETHHQFIDIQLPLSGSEIIGYTPSKDCSPADAPYNAEKDITFFEGESQTYITLHPGMFAIFFPEDGHAPGITPKEIKKVVVKVKA